MRNPPPIPSERLFRVLTGVPRPTWDVTCELLGGIPLTVSGLTPTELAGVLDVEGNLDLKDGRIKQLLCQLSLRENNQEFFSKELLDKLYTDELNKLFDAVYTGLSVCSPTYLISDSSQWERVLIEGARHPFNRFIAQIMATCSDSMHWRPDRYYGLPLCMLTEGHWLAFIAAGKAFSK